MIKTSEIHLETKGHCDVRDITSELAKMIENSGMVEGQVLAFVPGSTAGITTVEFEPGLVQDLGEFFQALIPEGPDYHHHATWGDDNGSSHLRAALLKPSLTIPFSRGRLLLGTWPAGRVHRLRYTIKTSQRRRPIDRRGIETRSAVP